MQRFAGVDLLPAALEMAREELIVKRGLNVSLFTPVERVDFIYSHQVFLFCTERQMHDALASIVDLLQPTGSVYLHFSAIESQPDYNGMIHHLFTGEEVMELCCQYFDCTEVKIGKLFYPPLFGITPEYGWFATAGKAPTN